MATKIIKGDDLMVFDGDKHSIAYATQHSLSLTADSSEINTKDHGIYGGTDINKINWEITSENLYTSSAFDDLFEKMMNREPVALYWGLKAQTDATKTVVNGDYEYWTPDTDSVYSGLAYITSLTANANTSENATFSVTFTGSGKITNLSEPIENGFRYSSLLPQWAAQTTQGGATVLTNYFEIDKRGLPDDAHKSATDWYTYLSVTTNKDINYNIYQWDDNTVNIEVNIGNKQVFIDTIQVVWTDANNNEIVGVPVNGCNVVKYGIDTNSQSGTINP